MPKKAKENKVQNHDCSEIAKALISLAGVLFVASGAVAILLIAVVEGKTNMVPFWDKVFLVSMFLGFAFTIIATFLFGKHFFQGKN